MLAALPLLEGRPLIEEHLIGRDTFALAFQEISYSTTKARVANPMR